MYCRTLGYLTEMHSYLSSQDIKLSIYRNRIRYEKNEFKFSKFYNRYVKTGDDPEIDFQKFYDNLKTAECILSIHPLDFIGASTDASFTSCLSVDSCHHTATTAYLKDDITIIAYTKSGDKKIGRQWVYIEDHYIVMGNIYGCISHPLQEKIRKLLEMKYAKHIGISNKWVISKDKSISEDCLNNCGHISNEHSDYSVYFDMDVAAKIRHKEGTDNFDGLFLDFSVGLNRYGENSYSGNLDLTYCTCCEEPIDPLCQDDTGHFSTII